LTIFVENFLLKERVMSQAQHIENLVIPDNITSDMVTRIDEICEQNRDKCGALIPVLQSVQKLLGYLPVIVQERIAQGLGIPGHEVFGVVTFYSFFTMKPRGRHVVRVCMGTACYVSGGKEVLKCLEEYMAIPVDNTTSDRHYTLEQVRCLGACGVAPVVVINQDTHRKVMADKAVDLVKKYE